MNDGQSMIELEEEVMRFLHRCHRMAWRSLRLNTRYLVNTDAAYDYVINGLIDQGMITVDGSYYKIATRN